MEISEDEPDEKSLVLIGVDPGSVNLGIGAIRFKGLAEYIDPDAEDGEPQYIPDIEIIAMERWDLQRGIIHQPTPNLNTKISIPLEGHKERSDKMKDWTDSVAQSIARSNWMFEPFLSLTTGKKELPLFVVENQCDQHKTDFIKNEMTQIQYILISSIQGIDFRRRWKTEEPDENIRTVLLSLRKYGQRNDKSRDRPERKEKASDDLKELLRQLNTENANRWLKYLARLEAKKEQIHDQCDAILLAVDKALTLYEEHLKLLKSQSSDRNEKSLLQKQVRQIPRVPTLQQRMKAMEPVFSDENLPTEDDCLAMKERKKRKRNTTDKVPKETKPREKKAKSSEDTALPIVVEVEKKKRGRKKKVSEVEEKKVNKEKKKDHKKQEEEYPKLLMERVYV